PLLDVLNPSSSHYVARATLSDLGAARVVVRPPPPGAPSPVQGEPAGVRPQAMLPTTQVPREMKVMRAPGINAAGTPPGFMLPRAIPVQPKGPPGTPPTSR